MAAQNNAIPNEDECPVPEDLIGQLHRSETPNAVEIAKTLSEQQRAQLAAFCYKRGHLHALGLKIASSCNRAALVEAAGPSGRTLYLQSRDPDKTLSQARADSSHSQKPVSLAKALAQDNTPPDTSE